MILISKYNPKPHSPPDSENISVLLEMLTFVAKMEGMLNFELKRTKETKQLLSDKPS